MIVPIAPRNEIKLRTLARLYTAIDARRDDGSVPWTAADVAGSLVASGLDNLTESDARGLAALHGRRITAARLKLALVAHDTEPEL